MLASIGTWVGRREQDNLRCSARVCKRAPAFSVVVFVKRPVSNAGLGGGWLQAC